MNFDCIIGNPPYNNDLYLDFVQAGYEALKPDGVMVMITPAKEYFTWGGAELIDKHKGIAEMIKRKADKVVVYPVCVDVFDISVPAGLMYYRMSKNDCDTMDIKTEAKFFDGFRHDTIAIKKSELISSFNISAYSILDKVGCNYNGIKIEQLHKIDNKKYKVMCSKLNQTVGGSSDRVRGALFAINGAGEVRYQPGYILQCVHVKETAGGDTSNYCISSFDTVEEAESLKSYIETRFVRFLVLIGANGYSNMFIDEMWRFVPDPGTFDHIFTDAELYQKYGLTQDEINIIESVIKERK